MKAGFNGQLGILSGSDTLCLPISSHPQLDLGVVQDRDVCGDPSIKIGLSYDHCRKLPRELYS